MGHVTRQPKLQASRAPSPRVEGELSKRSDLSLGHRLLTRDHSGNKHSPLQHRALNATVSKVFRGGDRGDNFEIASRYSFIKIERNEEERLKHFENAVCLKSRREWRLNSSRQFCHRRENFSQIWQIKETLSKN